MSPDARLWIWRMAAWLVCGLPLGWLIWRCFTADLGANPVETLEHASGEWALRLLLLTLAMSPLRQLSGATEAIRIRRLVGLWAFAWVTLHFSIYLVFDLGFSMSALGDDLVKRRYITLGFAAWLLLIPLAVTSTQGWQRRLKRRWKSLHRAIYAVGLLGAFHFLWLVKADKREPLIYLAILLVLLAFRVPWKKLLGRGAAQAA